MRGESAAQRISLLSNNKKVKFVKLDVANIASMESFSAAISKENLKIALLISICCRFLRRQCWNFCGPFCAH